MPRRRASLRSNSHAVYELAPDLLLVFKPKGHHEAAHSHPHRQRLRVVRGRLIVHAGKRGAALTPATPPFTLPPHCAHATTAAEATWVVVERGPAS
jgi:hypothetical protein